MGQEKCKGTINNMKRGVIPCPFSVPCPHHTNYWASDKFKNSLKRNYGKKYYKKRIQ